MVYLPLFGLAIISSVFWPVNAEALIVYGVLVEDLSPFALAGVFTLGQLVGKAVLYFFGKDFIRRWRSARRRVDRFDFQRFRTGSLAVIISGATVGLPPLYTVAIAAGIMRYPFRRLLILAALGRFTRFLVVALAPELFRDWSGL